MSLLSRSFRNFLQHPPAFILVTNLKVFFGHAHTSRCISYSHLHSQRLLISAEMQEEKAPPPKKELLITIPVHLKKRLEKRKIKESTKEHMNAEILRKSREGRKSQIVLYCKRQEFNHYFGQSYRKGEDVPLASRSWHNRRAAGDWFIIKPVQKSTEFGFVDSDLTFEDLGVKNDIIERLKENGALKPTFIQHLAIQKVLKGTNNLIAAETGCGKTLAYLIPLVQQILEEKRRRLKRGCNQPLAIILVPSHELCSQIFYVASKLTAGMGIDIKLLGKGNIGSKIANPSSQNIDLMISTISIISNLQTLGLYKMNRVQHVVLDEADTLLDDSFSDDVVSFLRSMSFNPSVGGGTTIAQLTLVSATLPKTIEQTLEDIVPIETFNRISTPGIHYVMSHVPQTFLRLKKSEKPSKLLELVKVDVQNKVPVMIFCNRTKTCGWMKIFLKENGISCISVHGELKPSTRKGLMDEYQNAEIDVMICTDLGSRGINTVRTQHVLNYEFPMYTADYIHRCGRTGRVGSIGSCKITNFITRRFEFEVVQEIERSIRKEISMSKVNANIKHLLHQRYGMYKPIIGDDSDGED